MHGEIRHNGPTHHTFGGTMRRQLLALIAAVLCLGLLTACTNDDGPDPLKTPDPTPATPEQQAEADAKEALEHFKETRDKVWAGEAPMEDLAQVAFGSGLVNTQASLDRLIQAQTTMEGDLEVQYLKTVSVELDGEYKNVVLEECTSPGDSKVLVDGVEAPDERAPYLVTTWTIAQDAGVWKVNGSASEDVSTC